MIARDGKRWRRTERADAYDLGRAAIALNEPVLR